MCKFGGSCDCLRRLGTWVDENVGKGYVGHVYICNDLGLILVKGGETRKKQGREG